MPTICYSLTLPHSYLLRDGSAILDNISFFLCMISLPPISTLFPYTTLFRSVHLPVRVHQPGRAQLPVRAQQSTVPATADRKSTRLNSSHVAISYAVFCLKKKIKNTQTS